jgi:hypothetical protein
LVCAAGSNFVFATRQLAPHLAGIAGSGVGSGDDHRAFAIWPSIWISSAVAVSSMGSGRDKNLTSTMRVDPKPLLVNANGGERAASVADLVPAGPVAPVGEHMGEIPGIPRIAVAVLVHVGDPVRRDHTLPRLCHTPVEHQLPEPRQIADRNANAASGTRGSDASTVTNA